MNKSDTLEVESDELERVRAEIFLQSVLIFFIRASHSGLTSNPLSL